MEFPDLGEQCSLPSCRQLDFLPFTCNACSKVFCRLHEKYDSHNCPEGRKKDKVVPTCPMCSRPVPLQPGDKPDDAVMRHIDNKCDSQAAKLKTEQRRANKCNYKGCKTGTDSVRVTCERCHLPFCLSHRHIMDHKCTAPKPVETPKPAFPRPLVEAVKTTAKNTPHRPQQLPTALHVHSLQQAGLSEDEAMRRAIELSLQSMGPECSTNDEDEENGTLQDESDEAIARALQEAEFSQQPRTPVTTARDKQSCCVS